jgi:hypothetical protein
MPQRGVRLINGNRLSLRRCDRYSELATRCVATKLLVVQQRSRYSHRQTFPSSPEEARLVTNDVANFWRVMDRAGASETNSRCLLQSFELARTLLENGTFNDPEPGPYRVFAVYSVKWPATS